MAPRRRMNAFDFAAVGRALAATKPKSYTSYLPNEKLKIKSNLKPKTGSKTVTTNKRRKNKRSGYGELSVQKYSGGRIAKKNLKGAWKVLRANTQRNVYAFQQVTRYMANPANPGAYGIASSFNGTAASGSYKLPVHLYSLHSVPNVINGAVTNPPAFYALQKSDTTATSYPSFLPISNIQAQNVSGTSTAFNSFPEQSDILKAVSMKFCLYGTLSRPTRFLFQIVQLRKPYLHPDYINQLGSGATNPASAVEMQRAAAFWEEMSKPFSYSPLSFVDNTLTKDLKVIKSFEHIIQPRTTFENPVGTGENTSNVVVTNAMPHSKIFTMYHKFNRQANYNWNDQVQTALPDPSNPAVVEGIPQMTQILGQNQTDVTWNARMYLMIRALSPIFTYQGKFDSTVQPSYDVSMRLYHENQG